MSAMSKILVSGSIAYDRIMDFPGLFSEHFVPDKMHNLSVSFQVKSFRENFGGCAGNIAYTLALLQEEPTILATAGNDFEAYTKHLQANNIDAASIHLDDKDVTASAYIITDQSDNQVAAYYPGSGAKRYGENVPLEGTETAIVSAGCDDDIKDLTALYRRQGLRFVFDPGQRVTALSGADLLEALSGATVLFANDYELGLIVFKTGKSERELLERVPTIVSTLGEKGARIITKDEELRVPAVHSDVVVDPTGAGDAHRAGFTKGLVSGLELLQCAQLGSTVAAYAVEAYGTQNHLFTMQDLAARYEKTFGEPLMLKGV